MSDDANNPKPGRARSPSEPPNHGSGAQSSANDSPSQLIGSHLDDSLTPSDLLRLEQWLSADSNNLREFVRRTHLHHTLRQQARAALSLPTPQQEAVPQLLHFPRCAPALAMAAALTLLATLLIWYFTARVGSPVIAQVVGQATIERGGQRLSAQQDISLLAGDWVHTAIASDIAIAFPPEATTLFVSRSTDMRLVSVFYGKEFFLRAGQIEASVSRQRPFHPMLIRTPLAEARVLGTKLSVTTTTNETRLDVTEGEVRFTRKDGMRVDVPAGYFSVAAAGRELSALPFPGKIYREYWTNVAGASLPFLLADKRYPAGVSGTEVLNELQVSNRGQNYGARIRGFIYPPVTGDYTFWIAASAAGSFWLSANSSPQGKVHTAHSQGDHTFNWSGENGEKSVSPLHLIAGRRYYFETLHKQALGSDYLALAWQIPGRDPEIITSEYLAPFDSSNGGSK